jgi:hypothetical protein
MARGGDAAGPLRKRGRASATPKDELARAIHHLGNNVHSLALRLLVMQSSDLPPDARSHLDAAHRLAQQSSDLVERIHELLETQPQVPPGPRRSTGTRRSRQP